MRFLRATHLHDRDTGLVKFGYRDYDPDTGRWCAKDPVGFAGGDTDLFGYCLNDPVNLVDPTGEYAGLAALAALGITIADIIANMEITKKIDPCDGSITYVVTIPPPSMFKNGFKLPFFHGAQFEIQAKDLPILGEIGVIKALGLLSDPSVVPSDLSNNPPAL